MADSTSKNQARPVLLFMRRYFPVGFALCIGIVLSFAWFNMLREQERTRTMAEFGRQAQTYVAAIRKGIERNLEALESVGGLYAASEKVERDDSGGFVQGPLSRYQATQALSWNKWVIHSERRQFEDSFRQEGYPELQIKDGHLDGQSVVLVERPEYIVVTYMEPYNGQQAAMGFDVASNPDLLAALERARDTGETVATAQISLVQETSNQSGFLILKPIYEKSAAPQTIEGRRQSLTGYAAGVIRIGDMVEAALEDLPKGIVNIQLVDEASPAGEGLLYLAQAPDSDNPAGEEQLRARDKFYVRESVEIPGRQWSLLLTPTSKFVAGQGVGLSWGVLGSGLFFTALLAIYWLSQIPRRIKIERLVSNLSKVNNELENETNERKLAEKALQKANGDLEKKVRESTEELEEANAGLEKEIVERERVTDQLIQSQKMESLGRLAGGISHDFSNLLTLIRGYTDLLQDKFDPDDPSREDLEEIAGAAERAMNLTAQLLGFSRRQMSRPRAINLNDLIVDFYPMLRRLIPEEIELMMLPAPKLWPVMVDPSQFEQVVMNLAVNARDAITNGGTITIETTNITLGEDELCRDIEAPSGECVELTVSDTGLGMAEDIQRQVFDPFFTTKEVDKGTGLGLSTCYGIVKQSGGHIKVSSTLGRGSTFRVYLPRTAEAADIEPSLEELMPRPRGTETILLVEDMSRVRRLAARVLRESGYSVLEAANGEEAVRVAEEFPGQRIDLLLTDVVMPQMGGLELTENFRASNPDTKVLVSSGYMHETDGRILDPKLPFLQKPYLPATLVSRVREVLDG